MDTINHNSATEYPILIKIGTNKNAEFPSFVVINSNSNFELEIGAPLKWYNIREMNMWINY